MEEPNKTDNELNSKREDQEKSNEQNVTAIDKNDNMKEYDTVVDADSMKTDIPDDKFVESVLKSTDFEVDTVCDQLQEVQLSDCGDIIQKTSDTTDTPTSIHKDDQEISGVGPERPRSMTKTPVDIPNPVGAGDTSITDDEIEVICHYSSPQFDEEVFSKSITKEEPTGVLQVEESESGDDFGLPLQDDAIIATQPLPQQMMFVNNGLPQGEFLRIGNHAFYNPGLNVQHGYHQQEMNPLNDQKQQLMDGSFNHQSNQSPEVYYQPYSTIDNNSTNQLNYHSPFPFPIPNPPMDPNMNMKSFYFPPNELNPNVPLAHQVPGMVSQVPANDGILYPNDNEKDRQILTECRPVGGYPEVMPWAEESEYAPEVPLNIVYPSIFVSASGLITLLLQNDVSVEMTVDRTIRLVNHQRRIAVATNSRGTASVLYTPSAKVCQNNTTTDAEVNGVRIRMMTDTILFGSGSSYYSFDYNYISPASPNFKDVSADKSVNLLFASESYGTTMVPQCQQCAEMAEYELLPKGGIIVRINGLKITQTGRGDVTVVSGPKFMKISPMYGYVRLNTHFTEMTVDQEGILRMRRGNHTIDSSNNRVILSNGKLEAGLDEQGRMKVYTLPKRQALDVGPSADQRRTRPGNPRRKATALGGAS